MASREHILKISCDLFLRRGCKSVTMDDIASEVGMSKRTLYELFRDKTQLLNECIMLMGRRDEEKIKELHSKSANVLEFLFSIHKYRTESRMSIYDNFFQEVKKYYPDVYEGIISKLRNAHFSGTREMILQGQEQGLFLPRLDVDMAAIVISEIINVIKNAKPVVDVKFNRNDFVKNTVFLFLRGMSTSIGIDIIDKFLDSENNI